MSAMTPAAFNAGPLAQALHLLPAMMDTPPARVAVIVTCLQESNLEHRVQLPRRAGGPPGPARGLAQFELGGGVTGVMRHVETRDLAAWLCRRRRVPFEPPAVWARLEHDDVLAAGFARLNLWWLPGPLARVGDAATAWAQYLEAWRPGAYTRGTPAERAALAAKFRAYYARAMEVVAP